MKKKMVALILTALLLGGCAGNLSHSTDLTATVSGAVIEKVDISGESYQPQNPKQKIAGWNLELLRESFSGENILLSPLSLTAALGMAANGTDVDLTDYFAIAKMVVPITDEFDTVCREDVYQLMMGGRKDEYKAILRGVDGAKIAAWWDRALDIIPASGGKGAGIGKILEYYGFDKAEAVAFGDGNNDIEMLQAVGDAVAMGNASDELKAVATEVCRPVTEDGVYWYCVENGLI